MERLQLTVALDQNFSEKELHKIAEAFGRAFNLKDRVYMLKASEENPPTAVFSFGEISTEKLPYLLGVMKSEYWRRVRKDVSKILSKRRKGEDPMVSFECVLEGLSVKFRCRTSDREIMEAAFERLDSALENLWSLTRKGEMPFQKAQVYLGFHEPTRTYRIDRAVVLTPEFGEYEYDEKTGKWSKVSPVEG
ncbi:MAG: hypothetical protein ACUVTM_04270 [Candidatus Bathyarchaeia archaeon]